MLGEQVEKFLVIPITHSGPVTTTWERPPWADCQSQKDGTPGPPRPTLPPPKEQAEAPAENP